MDRAVEAGARKLWDRLRVKRADADKLIDGIRRNFPELEAHLDPDRVASWDAGRPEENAPGLVPRIIRVIFIMLLVFALPRMISQCTEREDVRPPVVTLSEAEIDAKVAEVFGPGSDMKAVRAADPVLADQLRAAASRSEVASPLDLVRMKLSPRRRLPRDRRWRRGPS